MKNSNSLTASPLIRHLLAQARSGLLAPEAVALELGDQPESRLPTAHRLLARLRSRPQ